jgi:aminoglycoside 2'-N-acetyltransferase I
VPVPPAVTILPSEDLTPVLSAAIRGLLDAAFDGQFSADDWDHTTGGWHAVILDGDEVISHAAVVPRTLWVGDHAWKAGYVEGVATRPDLRSIGLGSRAMTAATGVVRDTFDLGALSTGSHAFYERLGWQRWAGPTFVRSGTGRIRTPDDDDGVMVLRFGPSAVVDLTAPITCEARAGDDW